MINYCCGCKVRHSDFNWVLRPYEYEEKKFKLGYFCRKWHKPSRTIIHSQKCDWEREKHIKDITQPFDHEEPNPTFAKMYKDEPEKLKKIYDKKQLKKVGLEKL
jgi:hypothetical protein